jgi:hypothetical protein
MRAVRDVVVLVMLVVLATVGMRVLTWQPVQATGDMTSMLTPAPDTDAAGYEEECPEARDRVELDSCTFSAAAYSLAYSEQAVCTVDPSPTFDPSDSCGAPPCPGYDPKLPLPDACPPATRTP